MKPQNICNLSIYVQFSFENFFMKVKGIIKNEEIINLGDSSEKNTTCDMRKNIPQHNSRSLCIPDY